MTMEQFMMTYPHDFTAIAIAIVCAIAYVIKG